MRDDIRHHRAKLTRAQVREIRSTLEYEPISDAALARRYGVSEPTISQIANYQTWRELDRPRAVNPSPPSAIDADRETISCYERDRLAGRSRAATAITMNVDAQSVTTVNSASSGPIAVTRWRAVLAFF